MANWIFKQMGGGGVGRSIKVEEAGHRWYDELGLRHAEVKVFMNHPIGEQH